MRPFQLFLAATLATATVACESDDTPVTALPPPTGDVTLDLLPVASGLIAPLYLTSPPNDPRQFIIEKRGTIRIVKDGTLLPTPFLDIISKVGSVGGEQGLLSVAFHPQYASNGFFYVNYTDLAGDTRVERYTVSTTNPDLANPGSAHLILTVDQPQSTHNGGLNLFGPDGKLYISLGDGGGSPAPAQNPNTLLGKILRIDVDAADPYAIPADNPFVGTPGTREEIWATGLRNPWRFTIDPTTNRLYIADVGENRFEEVNIVPRTPRGDNFGWAIMEGSSCFTSTPCDRTGLTLPIFEYGRADGCAIIGGDVYRGSEIPELVGFYFFADFCQHEIRAFRYTGSSVENVREWPFTAIGDILSFGTDASGRLYLLTTNGIVYRIIKVTAE